MSSAPDLVDLARRGAILPAAELRGLDGAWRSAEQTIAVEFAADRRGARRFVTIRPKL